MGFFNSRRAYKAIRRQGNYKPIFGAGSSSNDTVVALTKREQDKYNLGFTGYSLKYGNVMIVGDIETMLPQYQHDIDPDNHNLLNNGVFEGVNCDRVALIYSPKMKSFMYLGLNDDYSMSILFKADHPDSLPNPIDIENMHTEWQILENAGTLLNATYKHVADLTANPIIFYRISEVFRK